MEKDQNVNSESQKEEITETEAEEQTQEVRDVQYD